MNTIIPKRAKHRADLLALQRAVTDLDKPVPCCADPRAYSDNRAEQAAVARRCVSCPVIGQCRTYGLAYPRERGVYGGLTFSERQHQEKNHD